MTKRNYIIAAVISALVFLIVIAALAPSPDAKRIGTVSPLLVSPLGTLDHSGYLPLIECDNCPTDVPTLIGVTETPEPPTATIPPTLPRVE